MTDRHDEIQAFLAVSGWPNAQSAPLAADASARSYHRISDQRSGRCAVLMDAPPESGLDITPFVTVGRFLSGSGFSAPEIYNSSREYGLALIEDLGDDLFARICRAQPALEPIVYGAAVDLLANLQRTTPLPDFPAYSQDVYDREANLILDWYVPAVTGRAATHDQKHRFCDLIRSACARLETAPPCCVLRDFHAENLIWLPDRLGDARVGLLDFQDALIGHPAYDLVSLLKDARRDVTPDTERTMIARYLDMTGHDASEFATAYAVLGVQRNLKILGIFIRLAKRDKKCGYIDLLTRVWRFLTRSLDHPALVDLKRFVDSEIPAPDDQALTRIRRGSP